MSTKYSSKNPFAYQNRLDEHRILNDLRKAKTANCSTLNCKRKMNAIIDSKPYCAVCVNQYFEKRKGESYKSKGF